MKRCGGGSGGVSPRAIGERSASVRHIDGSIEQVWRAIFDLIATIADRGGIGPRVGGEPYLGDVVDELVTLARLLLLGGAFLLVLILIGGGLVVGLFGLVLLLVLLAPLLVLVRVLARRLLLVLLLLGVLSLLLILLLLGGAHLLRHRLGELAVGHAHHRDRPGKGETVNRARPIARDALGLKGARKFASGASRASLPSRGGQRRV